MGTQLQWVDGISDSKIIYNVRTQDKTAVYPGFGSRIRDIHTGDTRELPLPVYVVAPNGSYALSVDYRRLYITHEAIGYSEHRSDEHTSELQSLMRTSYAVFCLKKNICRSARNQHMIADMQNTYTSMPGSTSDHVRAQVRRPDN